VKLCTDCKHYEHIDFPPIFGTHACKHPKAWVGVEVESLGVPCRIDWARGASCGEEARNFEPK
jgi:hypothetical protein